MDPLIVQLQNELREDFLDNFPRILNDRYFVDISFLPKYPDDLFKATNLHFLAYSNSQEIEYINDILTKTEITVARPHFIDNPISADWNDRIGNFSLRVEFPKTELTHKDIISWERYSLEGTSTGRLELGDEEILDDDISAIDGMKKGIETSLSVIIPQYVERSERMALPMDFIKNSTPQDWENLGKIRPTNI